ncbi:MAG: MBL fold metallo-hydrolase [Myxococcales bacterium]|nr:MAG: MBL fold metallo-hydrolase [Myxococcales bacterium]
MQITILASGSSGNACLVQSPDTTILVDAGVRPGPLKKMLGTLARPPATIDAVLVTHAHSDHSGFAGACAHAFDATLYMTEATERGIKLDHYVKQRIYGKNTPFRIGTLDIHPMEVPHDAPQVALVFSHQEARAALVTDLGAIPPNLGEHIKDCHTLMIESNYDPSMLKNGPYPPHIQERVRSGYGHLSNEQCASSLEGLSPKTKRVVLMHLSKKNNLPELAHQAASQALLRSNVDLLLGDSLPHLLSIPSASSTRTIAAKQMQFAW